MKNIGFSDLYRTNKNEPIKTKLDLKRKIVSLIKIESLMGKLNNT